LPPRKVSKSPIIGKWRLFHIPQNFLGVFANPAPGIRPGFPMGLTVGKFIKGTFPLGVFY